MRCHRRCVGECFLLRHPRAARLSYRWCAPGRRRQAAGIRQGSIGKVIQGAFGQQLRHPFSGVALAYKHGIPGEVMHMIATHSHEGDKVERSIESIIFHTPILWTLISRSFWASVRLKSCSRNRQSNSTEPCRLRSIRWTDDYSGRYFEECIWV